LSTSFRFSQDIANLAMEVLKWKSQIEDYKPISILGNGTSKAFKIKAVLARTNLGLLLKAIEYVTEKKKVKYIYFEGNINSYTYADDGASLYDVLNLYNGKHFLIKDKLIKAMKDMAELEDYINKTEDVQLKMMVDIVMEYGNDIPEIIKEIKSKHVENDEKEKAEIIFSTVHRCKGMEYDTIQLVNDFIDEERLKKNIKNGEIDVAKTNEEINLLYVAITRTRNSIYIPESLVSEEFPRCPQIHLIRKEIEEEKELAPTLKRVIVLNKKSDHEFIPRDKAYTVSEVRGNYGDAYKPWTTEMDDELKVMYCEGVTAKDIAKHFGRTKGAIKSRIKKLKLVEFMDRYANWL
ncbi:MAG: 3'-5' exonuclease, partial [Paludibacter sp.]